MSVTSLIPLSEEWRHIWSFRTCVSTAVVTFLFLYQPTYSYLADYSLPAFCTFATIAVKDVTVGATVVNAWSCILGTSISCAISIIILKIVEQQALKWDHGDSTGILLFFLFISAFTMQYLEIQPMGKKMGVSFLPLTILGMNDPAVKHQELIWKVLVSVCFGSILALIGTIFPFPSRMAGTEVRERLNYCTSTISSLLKNSSYSWLIQPVRVGNRAYQSSLSLMISVKDNKVTVYKSSNYSFVKHSRWRKIRILLLAIIAFRRAKHYRIGWIHRSHHRAKDLYTRIEIIKFLQEELEVLVKRNTEARFGPNRTVSIRLFSRFVTLTRSFLTILLQLEKQVQDLETQSMHYPIYRSFFLSPEFRRRYTALVAAICAGYEQLHSILIINNYRYNETLIVDAMMTMHAIVETKDLFNREYFRLRKSVYYNLHSTTMPSFGTTNIAKDRHNVFSEVVEFPAGSETATSTAAQPLISEVLFNMNTVIFLLEEAANMIILFWNEDELNDAEDIARYLKDNKKAMATNQDFDRNEKEKDPVLSVSSPVKSHRLSARQALERFSTKSMQPFQRPSWKPPLKGVNRFLSWHKWVQFIQKSSLGVMNDLFPAQSHLWCIKLEPRPPTTSTSEGTTLYTRITNFFFQWQVSFQWTTAIEDRLNSAFTVAFAMTVAGIFGIYAKRPQAVMTAFTIAYLSGGSVSGINIMACLNRAAGTVIACVYSVTCIYAIELSAMHKEPVLARVFVGLAIVLFQYPATYIRTFPLYSYTGTCAGFTVGLLLIEYFDFTTTTVHISVNRIIDTFIAVFIYLVVELLFFAQMSEVTLLATLQKVILGIDQRFSRIYSHIVPSNNVKDTSAVAMVLASRKASVQEDIHKLLELDTMQTLLFRQRDLLPFYKSEPRITSAPALPDRLLQEALHWQEQAVMSLQIMMWVVQSCDDDHLHQQEHRIAEITTLITHIPDAITGSSLHKTQLKLVNPMVLERRRSLSARPNTAISAAAATGNTSTAAAAAADDSAEAMLLPLETQYREVELYISQALSFLSLSIQQLQRRPPPVSVALPPGDVKNNHWESERARTADYDVEEAGARNIDGQQHFKAEEDSKSIHPSNSQNDSGLRRVHTGQIAVGGGLVVNSGDNSIVPLNPVSQLRRIHQTRHLQMIREQEKKQQQLRKLSQAPPRKWSLSQVLPQQPSKSPVFDNTIADQHHSHQTLDPGCSNTNVPDETIREDTSAVKKEHRLRREKEESKTKDGEEIETKEDRTMTEMEEKEEEDLAVEPSFGEAAKVRHPAGAQTHGYHLDNNIHGLEHKDSSGHGTNVNVNVNVLAGSGSSVVNEASSNTSDAKPTQMDVRTRKASNVEDSSALEYVFFAEVEGQQVECLFSSYQQLLENIQARIMEHQVLSARDDIVVLGNEKPPAVAPASTANKDENANAHYGANNHDQSINGKNACTNITEHIQARNHFVSHTSAHSLSLRVPAPSLGDSRFTPAPHHVHTPNHHAQGDSQTPPLPPPVSLLLSHPHHNHQLNSHNSDNGYNNNNRKTKSAIPSSTTVLRIASNKEIKVVNTLLNSTKDLLQALRSLSRVISRLQAHRDIRWTQDARKIA